MSEQAAADGTIRRVLSVLAELSPDHDEPVGRAVVPAGFTWLPLANLPLLTGQSGAFRGAQSGSLDDLIALDAVRPGERSLAVGWLWVAGRAEQDDGRVEQYFEPLVTAPVVVDQRLVGDARLVVDGDLVLTERIRERSDRHRFERMLSAPHSAVFGTAVFGGAWTGRSTVVNCAGMLDRLPRLRTAAETLAIGAGFTGAELVGAYSDASSLATRDGLSLVVGLGMYGIHEETDFSVAGSLRLWRDRLNGSSTALHKLYGEPNAADTAIAVEVPSPYRLTSTQQTIVESARSDPITIVSGAPGTGKSHTIAAIVCDAVASDQSVLVATKSHATVGAITRLLDDRPGPTPVAFGSGLLREELMTALSVGRPEPASEGEVSMRRTMLREAEFHRDALRHDVEGALRGLALLGSGPEARERRRLVPGLGRPGANLVEMEALALRIEAVGTVDRWRRPPWHRRTMRRRYDRLEDLLGGPIPPPNSEEEVPQVITAVLDMARAARLVQRSSGEVDIGLDWTGLLEAKRRVGNAAGRWMEAMARDARRLTPEVRAARAALATALRASRVERRAKLAVMGREIATALPAWVGTLADIDDLLPMVPGLFDVVVLDEASSIDQPHAATGLLRGVRTVIVGDPQQLRHVSTISDAQNRESLRRHELEDVTAVASKLDVRRNSIFDVAAAAGDVIHLDVHFRSGIELFGWIGRRLYAGRVTVADQIPVPDPIDRLTVSRISGHRDRAGVVRSERDRVLERLQDFEQQGRTDIAVISPFARQAEAIERAVLAAFSTERIRAMGLSVGTVHDFQGREAATVLLSLGIGTDAGRQPWDFAGDPHLLAVMTTRAIRRMEIVVSGEPPPGMLRDYLDEAPHDAHASPREDRGRDVERPLTAALTAAGLEVWSEYDTGTHRIDLCIRRDQRFLGVERRVHPQGAAAHVDRRMALQEAGFPVVSALHPDWDDDPASLAARLAAAL